MIRRNVDVIAIAILIAGTLLCSAMREQATAHRFVVERTMRHGFSPDRMEPSVLISAPALQE